jgi:hypothetical protein
MMSELIRNVLFPSPAIVRRLRPPSTFVEKSSPIAGSSEGTFLSSPEGCQSPQNQAQKRGSLIIYASIEAHEDQFTLSLADQFIGRGWSPNQTTGIKAYVPSGQIQQRHLVEGTLSNQSGRAT